MSVACDVQATSADRCKAGEAERSDALRRDEADVAHWEQCRGRGTGLGRWEGEVWGI